jgi:vacuolar-type H+-ATPase subunit E/Vma4
MLRQLTISEAICVGALCVFAIGTSRAADPAATDRKNEYKVAIANADADYKAAKEACKSHKGNDRDVCLKQAKADHVKATSEAKARLESKSARADAREDTIDAQYQVAKEKCDVLSGDAKDSCVKQAKLKYHQ